MLIIPFDRKVKWENAPLITLLLITVNCLIFFIFHAGEVQHLQKAIDYYNSSELPKLEITRFRDELKHRGEFQRIAQLDKNQDSTDAASTFALQFDKPFMDQLRSGEIIKPSEQYFSRWQGQRSTFETLLNDVAWIEYGLKPGELEITDLFIHMFLHANLLHLLGNMIFLFAVGFMVEATIGRPLYLLAYLASGVGAAALNIAIDGNSIIPSIGASGAIAGLMGLYAVLFGLRKVNFFYFIVVYFDYVKAPAIVLLVFWLGNEIYQQVFWSAESNVNYLAHIGGLLSGAIVAVVLKSRSNLVNEDYLNEKEREQHRHTQLRKFEELMVALDFQKATALVKDLLYTEPDDLELLFKLNDCSKHSPETDDYHQCTLKLLALNRVNAASKLELYKDYIKRAKPKARLTKPLIDRMLRCCIQLDAIEEAERIMMVVLKNPKTFEDIPKYLLMIVNSLRKNNQLKKSQLYMAILQKHFPDSQEIELLREI